MAGEYQLRDFLRENPGTEFDTDFLSKHFDVSSSSIARATLKLYSWKTKMGDKIVRGVERREVKLKFGMKYLYKATEAT